jgi:hypothetical protein
MSVIVTRVPGPSCWVSTVQSSPSPEVWERRIPFERMLKVSNMRAVKKMPWPGWAAGSVVSFPFVSSRMAWRSSMRSM